LENQYVSGGTFEWLANPVAERRWCIGAGYAQHAT